MNYPIFLTNMNRLSTTKKMVENLFRMNPNAGITIIDNASTYPPLLSWYKEIKNDVKLIKHDINRGPWCFFYSGIFSKVDSDYYIYSDADLELNPEMPNNWQEILMEYHKKYNRKASLVLRLDDVPEGELKNTIKFHQQVCWGKTEEENVWHGVTDMTFSFDAKSAGYRYDSVRIGGNFACRHIPWYEDVNSLSEEEKYYIEHLDNKYGDAVWSRISREKYESRIHNTNI
jgi:hypothetical protein